MLARLHQPWRKARILAVSKYLALAIAITVTIPSCTNTNPQANLIVCKSQLNDISAAMEMYAVDFENQYPTKLTQLTPNYLKVVPQCPNYFQTSYHLQTGADKMGNAEKDDHYFLISCVGSNHLDALPKKDYPKCNNVNGIMESPADMPK